jgi:hypothetical protein
MFHGKECLRFVIMLHHFQLTQYVEAPVEFYEKRATPIILPEVCEAVVKNVKNTQRLCRRLGATDSI